MGVSTKCTLGISNYDMDVIGFVYIIGFIAHCILIITRIETIKPFFICIEYRSSVTNWAGTLVSTSFAITTGSCGPARRVQFRLLIDPHKLDITLTTMVMGSTSSFIHPLFIKAMHYFESQREGQVPNLKDSNTKKIKQALH